MKIFALILTILTAMTSAHAATLDVHGDIKVNGKTVITDAGEVVLQEGVVEAKYPELCQLYQSMIESGKSVYTEMPSFCNPVPPKLVFMTPESYTGDLGGISGADQKCQDLADGAGLDGRFKAFLSVGPDTGPHVRFTHSVSPYVLIDGTEFAANWADLLDGHLSARLEMDMNGQRLHGYVWTNTHHQGASKYSLKEDTCNGFTTSRSGWYGSTGLPENYDDPEDTDPTFDSGRQECSASVHLYCFQQ